MNCTLITEFFVPGDPVGKGRARSTLRGFKTGEESEKVPVIGHYTPKKTRSTERTIAALARQAVGKANQAIGPIHLQLMIVHAIPASWPKWKREMAASGAILPTVKPDANNVEKLVEDALNGVLWRDDSQVVSAAKSKCYGHDAGIHVAVYGVEGYPASVTRAQIVRYAASIEC